MPRWSRPLLLLCAVLLAAGAVWRHADMQWSAWTERTHPSGFDYASFHFAVKVAAEGGDPYNAAELAAAGRRSRERSRVHPFFYPPPAILLLAWTYGDALRDAYHRWFWLDELAAILSLLVLWRWWRALGPAVPVALFAVLAYLTAFHDNHLMGQVNLPVMLVALLGLWAADRGHRWTGGMLLGVACMAKMAPALFVADALLRRRWRVVGGAVWMAGVLSTVALVAYGPAVTRRFWVDVLPGFASGDYNGLKVPITLWANHSIPNLWVEWFPAAVRPWREVSDAARFGSRLTLVGLLGLGAWRSVRAGDGQLDEALRVGAVGVGMLLVPLYTYEHHLVWAIPAAVASLAALAQGRVPRGLVVVWLAAFAVWTVDLPWWKATHDDVPEARELVRWSLREGKLLALLAFGGLCLLGLTPSSSAPPAEEGAR